jgi:hypothetical protein
MNQDLRPALPGGAEPCRYGSSRLFFRGPERPLGGRHIAFVGGSETVARAVARPYPALLEEAMGEVCVNFGQHNGSVEAFLQDTLVPKACSDAAVTVVTAMGAQNVSNRLYSVHPRRNDRFLRASNSLRKIYPGLDLSDVHFTRHLLMALRAAAPDRFEVVEEELRIAWFARMRTFLDRIGPRVVLLWFASHLPPEEGAREEVEGPLGRDPLFVTRPMLEALRPLVREIVVVPPAPPGEDPEDAHFRAAEALVEPLGRLLPPRQEERAAL